RAPATLAPGPLSPAAATTRARPARARAARQPAFVVHTSGSSCVKFHTALAAGDLRPVAISRRARRRPQRSVSALYSIMNAGTGLPKFCELHQIGRLRSQSQLNAYRSTPALRRAGPPE